MERVFSMAAPGPLEGALALVLLATVLWYLIALRSRRRGWVPVAVAGLRLLSLSLLLFFILRPLLQYRRVEAHRPSLAILVDASRSMGLRGGGASSRFERVAAFLESEPFRELTREYRTETFLFSDTLETLPEGGLAAAAPAGGATDVPGALTDLLDRQGPALGGLIVFTDGGHGPLPAAVRARRAALSPPVVFIGVGAEESYRDVEVTAVESTGLAFAGKPVRLTARIRASGYEGKSVPLIFRQGAQVVSTRDVPVTEGPGVQEITFEWTPPRPGTYHFTVEAPPRAGEDISENNIREFTLRAARDKIRVLLLSGRPGWHYRFLRESLKGSPSVDLVSFIILRTATDAVNVPQQDLSLIPFPTKKIFLEELDNFDLLIFDNFSYRPYLPPLYLEKLEEFVKAGGGFWMLGGPLSFSDGGYAGTALEKVLPVLLGNLPSGEGYRDVKTPVVLAEGAAAHPFFQGLGETDPADLPDFDGYNPTGPPREGAVVLLERGGTEAGGQPLMVLGRYGEGRVLTVMSESLWRWNFELAGRNEGNRFFHTLVRQALYWSIGDPQLEPVRVSLEREILRPSETLRGTVRVFGDDFRPLSGPDLRLWERNSRGQEEMVPYREEQAGIFSFSWPAKTEGTYEIFAEVRRGQSVHGEDSAPFSVKRPLDEFAAPGLNSARLEELATAFPGATVELSDPRAAASLRNILDSLIPSRRFTIEESRGIWEYAWAFGLLIFLLTAEWSLRKRQGLE